MAARLIFGLTCLLPLLGTCLGQYRELTPMEGNQCPANWVDANSKCYLFVTSEKITFEEAVTECNEQQATLLVIDTQDDVDFLSDELDVYPTDGFWTALVRQESYWYWKDQYGVDMSLIKWNVEPDNANGKENCGAVNTQLTFSDEDCAQKLGFICEMPLKQDPDNPCSEGWGIGQTNCYYVSSREDPTEMLTWKDAVDKCKYMDDGSSLLAMRDDEKAYLTLVLPEQVDGTFKWWTSLNRQDNSLYWGTQYADSQQIKWTKEPNNLGGGENCGVLYDNEMFSDADCTQEKNYICEKNDNTIPQNAEVGIFGCDRSWMRAGHKCYYFESTYKATWSDGRQTCLEVGGDFLKTENPDEAAWVSWVLSSIDWQAYWSGLNDQSTEGTWVWADGTALKPDVVQWNAEPNDVAGKEDCAMLMPDGVFNDGRCGFKTGYICEAYPEDSPCPSTWIDQDAACYFFQPGNSENTSLTWYEARDRCRDLALPANGFLVALSSRTEQEFVIQNVMGFGPDATAFWTGLNDRFDEGLWTYDTDFNNPPDMSLIQWNTEPNGGQDANCAVIMSGARYDDQDCNIKHNFICEKPVQASHYLRYGNGSNDGGKCLPSPATLSAALLVIICITSIWNRLQ
ncbi:macrophage mannose receptor 1-like [Liolophura sinensis]|uniref:macrophage mannose receptor 1-like n=1 Tax=Liolophura sinensis TaxID=3198878 RepID=UPI00315926B3